MKLGLNYLLCLLILFVTMTAITPGPLASGDWHSQSFSKDSHNHYYVGVSEGKENLNEAMEESYQHAIDEALRHNFGFSKQGQKSIQASLFKTSIDERSFIKTQTVTLKEVKPGLQKVTKTNKGRYLVYRQVIYPIEAITREKARLRALKSEDRGAPNEYGLQGKTLGEVLIRTTPSNAQILLTRVDGKGSVIGTGDARFRVPLGEYHVTLIKDGHHPHKDKILVSGKETKLNYQLKESLGFLKLDVAPIDAKIYIDNQKAKNKSTIPLKVGRDYTVRIEHGDYQTHVQSISPWIDQVITLDNELIPKKGRFTVITQPAGARVFIEGQPIGKSPLKDIPYYPSDDLEIKVVKAGFDSQSIEINLKANQDHSPVVLTLKKSAPRRPTSVRSIEVVESRDENLDLSFLSNNTSRHNWIYNPVVGDNEKTTFILVPIQYQFYLYRHLALGLDYRYHLETEDVTLSQVELKKETVSQVWSVNSTLYLVRNRKFSLGFGPEYTWRKNQVRYMEPGSTARLASFEKQKEALGYKALIQLGLSERKNGHQFGLNIDYRKYDYKNSELGSWSIGLYWEF